MKHIAGGRNSQTTLVLILALSWVGTDWMKGQDDLWSSYKQQFISSDGRVVDTGNGGVSHSEGQGYGMLLAEAHADRVMFSRLWAWTTQHLGRAEDHLFSWRWRPFFAGGGVDDHNDAADGDLLIAWALLRGAEQWNAPEWRQAGLAILRDVKQKLIRTSAFGPILLPGADGFQRSDGLVVNLSYWLFPAFKTFSHADHDSKWNALEQSGLQLLGRARFGTFHLPPDWLLVNADKLSLPGGFEAVYGYNAVRIPLYLAWAKISNPTYYENFARVAALNAIPAKVPLAGWSSAGSQAAPPGMLAIYHLVRSVGDWSKMDLPYEQIQTGETYYSATLGLLTDMAVQSAKE